MPHFSIKVVTMNRQQVIQSFSGVFAITSLHTPSPKLPLLVCSMAYFSKVCSISTYFFQPISKWHNLPFQLCVTKLSCNFSICSSTHSNIYKLSNDLCPQTVPHMNNNNPLSYIPILVLLSTSIPMLPPLLMIQNVRNNCSDMLLHVPMLQPLQYESVMVCPMLPSHLAPGAPSAVHFTTVNLVW